MTDKEEIDAGSKPPASPSKKVRIMNGRKVGRIFVEADVPLEPGESALVSRKLAEYLVALGGVIVEDS